MRRRSPMAGTRGRPSMKKLASLIVALIVGVLFYRKLSSLSLDSLLEPRMDRKLYESLYAGAMDEAADWRQRYDSETAKTEQQKEQYLKQVEVQSKKWEEERENLKARIDKLQQELREKEA